MDQARLREYLASVRETELRVLRPVAWIESAQGAHTEPATQQPASQHACPSYWAGRDAGDRLPGVPDGHAGGDVRVVAGCRGVGWRGRGEPPRALPPGRAPQAVRPGGA